jgi:hypothetical protein
VALTRLQVSCTICRVIATTSIAPHPATRPEHGDRRSLDCPQSTVAESPGGAGDWQHPPRRPEPSDRPARAAFQLASQWAKCMNGLDEIGMAHGGLRNGHLTGPQEWGKTISLPIQTSWWASFGLRPAGNPIDPFVSANSTVTCMRSPFEGGLGGEDFLGQISRWVRVGGRGGAAGRAGV